MSDYDSLPREILTAPRNVLWRVIINHRDEIARLRAKVDALQNEVNAVEWMNGRIEKELFDCRRRT